MDEKSKRISGTYKLSITKNTSGRIHTALSGSSSQFVTISDVAIIPHGFLSRIYQDLTRGYPYDLVAAFTILLENDDWRTVHYHPGSTKSIQKSLTDLAPVIGMATTISLEGDAARRANMRRAAQGIAPSRRIHDAISHFHDSKLYPTEGYYDLDGDLAVAGIAHMREAHGKYSLVA